MGAQGPRTQIMETVMQARAERMHEERHDGFNAPDVSLLVHRARNGDRAAFEQLYRLHVSRVHALCLRLCDDRDEAATLTQDAFVRAWQHLGSYRGDSQLLTWLHRLTVNVVLDHRRAWRRRALLEIADGEDPGDRSSVHYDRTSARLDLEKALATLPPGARTVFVLHEVEGYRQTEIALMTGVALGTVKSQLHRARALLREVLR